MSPLPTRGDFIGSGILGSILARLERLERQRQGVSEASVPNTYRVDASGNVIVSGVVLPEAGSNALSPGHAVQWQDTSAITREFVQGFISGGAHELDLVAQADAETNPNNSAQITAHAEPANAQQVVTIETTWGPGNSDPALIQVASQDNALHRDFIRVQTKAGSRTIFDDLADSSFVQIVNTLQQFRVDIGAFVNVPGTSSVTVSHSLGVVPKRIMLTPAVGPGVTPGRLSVDNTSQTTTQFKIQNADATSTDCYWMAFG